MARPPLDIGTYGKVSCKMLANGTHVARAKFRDFDGVTRDVERTGPTKPAAERNLKVALRDRAKVVGEDLTSDSKIRTLVDLWWAEWLRANKDRSPNTQYSYRRKIDLFIVPGLGGLHLREMSVGRANRFLRDIEEKHGGANAKMTRSVLSNMCAFACQQGAMEFNPIRDVGRISVRTKAATAMTIPQVRQLLAYMTYDPQAIARDVLPITEFLAATGVRIGEALGLRWSDIDFEAGTVAIRYQVIRVVGVGLVLKKLKTDASVRILELPSWELRSLELRRITAVVPATLPVVRVLDPHDGSLSPEQLTEATMMVFPSTRTGAFGPRDPSNVGHQVKDAYAFAGLDITSHKFRKTVLTEMDKANLSARAAADQAGHAQVSMTQNVYFGRKVAKTGAATVLEAIGADD